MEKVYIGTIADKYQLEINTNLTVYQMIEDAADESNGSLDLNKVDEVTIHGIKGSLKLTKEECKSTMMDNSFRVIITTSLKAEGNYNIN